VHFYSVATTSRGWNKVLSDRKFNGVCIENRKLKSQCSKVLQLRIMLVLNYIASLIQTTTRILGVTKKVKLYVLLV
jgi:hypothetical protein